MSSMLVIHATGQADPIRIEPNELLDYASYCTQIAHQLLVSYKQWQESEAGKAQEMPESEMAQDAPQDAPEPVHPEIPSRKSKRIPSRNGGSA